jgi:glycosyltransferase involved in cell wall biosynthesis
MIDEIKKYQKSSTEKYEFSVLIPTWNNLEYLKLCIRSIKKNSSLAIQIIVLINEGRDGTIEWLEMQNDIDYIHAQRNIGICYGLNSCRSLIKSEYIIYLNDDMYVLPKWDLVLQNEIKNIGSKEFMLSSTMIEPHESGNPCVVVGDYGRDIESFNEDELLKEYAELSIDDWSGSTWPPNVVHVDLWDLVGGLSIEFSPGIYSDPDFSRKLYEAGIRMFKGKGDSLVYHFGSKSTGRVKKNKGRKTFLLKWGITSNTFTQEYLTVGNKFAGRLTNPNLSKLSIFINKLKRMASAR